MNKKYWDKNYQEYWSERVKNNSTERKNDPVPDNSVFDYFFDKIEFSRGKILDLGCGFGRMFSSYIKYSLEIYGLDISSDMINQAKKKYPEISNNLFCNEAEKMPFESDFFDFLVCFGVFDCTYQEKVLSEVLRVLKKDGECMITGKNFNYHKDDKLAKEAEIGAKKKGEPNYFTNYNDMEQQLLSCGHSVEKTFFFEYRGDFTKKNYTVEKPKKFYEYLTIIKKKSDNLNLKPFYFDKSELFYEN